MNPDSAYFKTIVENSPSFYRIYLNSYKLFVIELAKILDSKENFSIISTVNFLIINRKKIIWKNSEIQLERLNFIRDEIKNVENLHLKSIKNLRDKFYAHTDKNRHEIELSFNLQLGWEILKQLRSFFEEIVLKVNNQQIMFSVLSNLTNEMVLLQRYKLIQNMIQLKLKEQPNIGELQNVRDIMLGKIKQ